MFHLPPPYDVLLACLVGYVMAGVQFPLDMSRLYRNIPQRHNKELFDFWHRRAERPDPSQERAQLSAQLRLEATSW